MVAQEGADRRGDVGRRQRRGRNLIQERLEQMMVRAVDQQDIDGRAGEPGRRCQSAEAAAHDDDALPLLHVNLSALL